jgi:hypothetical protein
VLRGSVSGWSVPYRVVWVVRLCLWLDSSRVIWVVRLCLWLVGSRQSDLGCEALSVVGRFQTE